ncbi:DUF917 domain-containing protein [Salinithrix halophila]|uniref:DUF917 domain-containing protein n=1 Tax=Salinithrix halophila TaxID=1485204 RepID=UPI0036D3F47E
MRYLTKQSIEDIAIGAAVLGTGGGGDPTLGRWMALAALEEHGPCPLLSVDEVDDEALVVPSGMMGAPTVLAEKIPGGTELDSAFELMEQALGRRIEATMPVEVGGVNSLLPLVLALRKGIPVIDADAMGRAFPEVHMTSFHLDGLPPGPAAIADEKGNGVLLYPKDGTWYERLARDLTIQMGCSVAVLDYPLSGQQVKQSGILSTLSLAEQWGSLLRQARGDGLDPAGVLMEKTGALPLIRGKVTDVDRRTDGGFTKGALDLEGIEDWRGKNLQLSFQNEFLVARAGEEVLASTPDLITVLDNETGLPITTEAIRYGMRVWALAFPCHPKWRTERGIDVVGPRCFGYDFEFVPAELRRGVRK